jgi:hypothetical protein
LTALVTHVVRVFHIDLAELHQDTTTVTFSGRYDHSSPGETPPHHLRLQQRSSTRLEAIIVQHHHQRRRSRSGSLQALRR